MDGKRGDEKPQPANQSTTSQQYIARRFEQHGHSRAVPIKRAEAREPETSCKRQQLSLLSSNLVV